MTICIAAICRDEAQDGAVERKIVLCTDQKSSSALGSNETARKEIVLSNRWRCLTAGDEPDIIALARLYSAQFEDREALLQRGVDASIKEPLHQRKAELAEEYIRRRFAISYDEFLKSGRERLPAEVFAEAVQFISQLRLNAEFILAGFQGIQPLVYFTDSSGEAKAANHFAAIGEGEYIARSALLRRSQDFWTPLKETLYNVYEAKRLAESLGSVGKETSIAVFQRDGSRRLTSVAFDYQLEAWYGKFGPQQIKKGELSFKGDIYFSKNTPSTS